MSAKNLILRVSMVSLAAVLPGASASAAPTASPFRADDRWISIGDSITQSGLYARYVEYFSVTRDPSSRLTHVNAGISGDTLSGVLRRFDWDIAPTRPTVATVMLGMNDVGRSNYSAEPASAELLARRQVSLTDFEQNLRALVPRLQKMGTRVVIVSPTPYDDTTNLPSSNHPGCNAALAGIARIGRTVATDTQSEFIDLHAPLTDLNHQHQSANPTFTLIGGDRVHPGAPGHFAAAFHLLKALDARARVASVHLDVARPADFRADHCRVTDLAFSSDALSFTYLADALPFHVPEDARAALDWVPFSSELNSEELRITNLAAGTWKLTIDDHPVADLTDTELNKGVNLSEFATPQLEQSRAVLALLEKRWELTARLRLIAAVEHQHARDLTQPPTAESLEPALAVWEEKLSAEPPDHWQRQHPARYREWKPAQTEIQSQADEFLRQARVAATPRARKITLTRLPTEASASPSATD